MYAAKIIADSVTYGDGDDPCRLTTMEVVFPRFILAEFNTHRVFSRNSASSRAIPVEKRISQVRENPFVPEAFGKNKSGMQASESLSENETLQARIAWLDGAHRAIEIAERLCAQGVHKQHANRVLEPYAWHTVVVSSTRWRNFFNLRRDKNAQPEMQIIANMMFDAYLASVPEELVEGEWHLPYVHVQGEVTEIDHNASLHDQIKMSVVACAAVSFERQNAHREMPKIIERHDSMVKLGHWSPFEHQAVIDRDDTTVSNFEWPWKQYRKTFAAEAVWTPPVEGA